jgi:hypothetical protein
LRHLETAIPRQKVQLRSKYNLLEVELVKLVLKTLVEAMFLTLAE